MCGIVGLHLKDPALYPQLGRLTTQMLCQVSDRGPDSAGVALYGDARTAPPQLAAVSLLTPDLAPAAAAAAVRERLEAAGLEAAVTVYDAGQSIVVRAAVDQDELRAATVAALPEAVVIGYGEQFAVHKGVGHPQLLAEQFGLAQASGWQSVAHTRMATESAVTPAGSHPFSVGPGQCLVHNGSFANHATIRRDLQADGVHFDSDNDSEVGARFVAHQLAQGTDVDKALRLLCERFDGFYTLLVTTPDSFAVVRDAIACKPAVIAVTPRWVAMASEYRALSGLPGADTAEIFEPEPEEVYLWRR